MTTVYYIRDGEDIVFASEDEDAVRDEYMQRHAYTLNDGVAHLTGRSSNEYYSDELQQMNSDYHLTGALAMGEVTLVGDEEEYDSLVGSTGDVFSVQELKDVMNEDSEDDDD